MNTSSTETVTCNFPQCLSHTKFVHCSKSHYLNLKQTELVIEKPCCLLYSRSVLSGGTSSRQFIIFFSMLLLQASIKTCRVLEVLLYFSGVPLSASLSGSLLQVKPTSTYFLVKKLVLTTKSVFPIKSYKVTIAINSSPCYSTCQLGPGNGGVGSTTCKQRDSDLLVLGQWQWRLISPGRVAGKAALIPTGLSTYQAWERAIRANCSLTFSTVRKLSVRLLMKTSLWEQSQGNGGAGRGGKGHTSSSASSQRKWKEGWHYRILVSISTAKITHSASK